ncbi:MAG: hypothetical protein JSR45_03000 [Proteobacteria bacterium]|nr:hypothetical protein [Pseudomonadota bacterium]
MCGMALAASLALADLYGAGPAARPVQPVSALSQEPLYAQIVSSAQRLEADAKAMRALPGLKSAPSAVVLPGFAKLKSEAMKLSAMDMQGHLDLAARKGGDGDLKCILKGISQDLPKKIAAVEDAKTGPEQDLALDELAYVLDDNAGVILAPPKPPV